MACISQAFDEDIINNLCSDYDDYDANEKVCVLLTKFNETMITCIQ